MDNFKIKWHEKSVEAEDRRQTSGIMRVFERAQKNDEKKSSVIIAGLWDKIYILNLQNKTQL